MLLALAYHYAHRGGENQAQTKPHRLPLIVIFIFDQVKITIQTSHSSVGLSWHPGSLHRNKSVHVLADKEKYQSSWKKNKKKNSSISNTWFVHQRALIIYQLKGILRPTNLLSYLIVGELPIGKNVMRSPQ